VTDAKGRQGKEGPNRKEPPQVRRVTSVAKPGPKTAGALGRSGERTQKVHEKRVMGIGKLREITGGVNDVANRRGLAAHTKQTAKSSKSPVGQVHFLGGGGSTSFQGTAMVRERENRKRKVKRTDLLNTG